MASSKRNEVFDPIRNTWVLATPEEIVRQKCLLHLFQLGYPKSLITVEKELRQLPHLKGRSDIPNRRLDLICFVKGSTQPLLLIECKEGKASPSALTQLEGYNHFVCAPFLAVVDEKSVQFRAGSESFNFLPPYSQLCQK